jgi:hypothetical protein
MLKIRRTESTSMKSWTMSQLSPISVADAGQRERELQQLIFNSWPVFMSEIGENLFLVGQEVEPSENVKDKIDLLAFDEKGTAVILELKRGSNKWQLSQGLCYAAMIAEWTPDKLEAILTKYGHSMDDLYEHVEEGTDSLNHSQRIILIAEDYDYEVLITAKWLIDHAIRVSCWQIALARDPDGSRDYLHCVQIFPHKKLEEMAIQRGRQHVAEAGQVKTIEQLLENCSNPDEKAFFSKRLEKPRNSKRDALVYLVAGTFRWYVEPRPKCASVYQYGRFDGDERTWTDSLSEPRLSPRKVGALHFHLTTALDFDSFEQFVQEKGKDLAWTKNPASGDGGLTAPDPEDVSKLISRGGEHIEN